MEKQPDSGQEKVMSWAGEVVANFYRGVAAAYDAAIPKDPIVQAFFRQGVDELGKATQAFPDSIQQFEPGAMWTAEALQYYGRQSPGEIADAGKAAEPMAPPPQAAEVAASQASPSPAQIADGGVHGKAEAAAENLQLIESDAPSLAAPPQGEGQTPSQIADQAEPNVSDGNEPGRDMEHGRER